MKFKGFWKELGILYKYYGAWLKDYWFAYILLCIVITIPCFIWIYRDYVTSFFEVLKDRRKERKEND